jgi:hypothetical protein
MTHLLTVMRLDSVKTMRESLRRDRSQPENISSCSNSKEIT